MKYTTCTPLKLVRRSSHLCIYNFSPEVILRKFECNLCDEAFSKKTGLVRHMKRLHPGREMKGTYQVLVKQPGEKSLSRKVDADDNRHDDIRLTPV